jgi:hypothetical protein
MNKIIFFLMVFSLNSCSFQSSQYEVIKSLIKSNSSQGPEKNWRVVFNGKQQDLYAVNLAEKIIFADEVINIFYEKQQIYKITGLFSNDAVVEVRFDGSDLAYYLNDTKISHDTCEVRILIPDVAGGKNYIQQCYDQKSGLSYRNQIKLNSREFITGLYFRVHPDYPSLELSLK